MRIAIGQLWQETNTLNPLPTTRAEFEQFGVLRGAEVVNKLANTNELGGFCQSVKQWPEPPELVGLARIGAWPGGTTTVEAFEWICHELMKSLVGCLPVDAVYLALHGSLAAEQHPDVEGEILLAVRQAIGPETPLVASLDLHANVTREMVAAADVLVAYHTMPHVDVFETGQRSAGVLRRMLLDGARPVTAFQKIPAVVPAERSSTEADAGIAVDMKRRIKELETRPNVLAAGVTPVQPWLDVPQLGASVLVTTDGDEDLARRACAEIAAEFWERRREYLPELTPVDEAVRQAHEETGGLVVLSDPADATTSGAPGDSVWILQELLRYAWPRPALVTLVAPPLVERASAAGVGASFSSEVGGVRDVRFGTKLKMKLTVERLFPAQFVMSGHLGKNMSIDMGASAVLRQRNIVLVVTTRTGPHFAAELFRAAGYDPFAAAVLIAKSPCGFRAVYEGRAKKIVSVGAPGCAPSDFWKHPCYDHIPRPLWPWDEINSWRPAPTIRK